MQHYIASIVLALLAAILYAVNIPLSKILLQSVHPVVMASLLYLGAGIGISLLSCISKKEKQSKLTKKEIPFTVLMVVLDIVAPILLMFGLQKASSSNVALISNFEIVATAVIAFLLFKENISLVMWIAIMLVTLASIILSFDITALQFSVGSLYVLLACITWGLENNCTKALSSKNIFQIVSIKGIFSGLGSLVLVFVFSLRFPALILVIVTLLLGFIAYGLSIYCYVKSQNSLGAAKTSAFYALNPFIGSFLSFIILQEKLSENYLIAVLVMIVGTVFIILDLLIITHKHAHIHSNNDTVYEHTHIHFHWQNTMQEHQHKHITL